jgi:CheY-like chemotaxis protein
MTAGILPDLSRVAAEPAPSGVIVVEDNLDAAESLMMLIEVLGHRVRVVHDGPAALEAALREVPGVMLVDIGLPGMDGYELARRLRQQPELAETRLIALTGYGREEDRRCALAAGFDHHLIKPIEFDILRQVLAPVPPIALHASPPR